MFGRHQELAGSNPDGEIARAAFRKRRGESSATSEEACDDQGGLEAVVSWESTFLWLRELVMTN